MIQDDMDDADKASSTQEHYRTRKREGRGDAADDEERGCAQDATSIAPPESSAEEALRMISLICEYTHIQPSSVLHYLSSGCRGALRHRAHAVRAQTDRDVALIRVSALAQCSPRPHCSTARDRGRESSLVRGRAHAPTHSGEVLYSIAYPACERGWCLPLAYATDVLSGWEQCGPTGNPAAPRGRGGGRGNAEMRDAGVERGTKQELEGSGGVKNGPWDWGQRRAAASRSSRLPHGRIWGDLYPSYPPPASPPARVARRDHTAA
ncbi:hypothetical protein B0H13DRAFT_1908752 [Mycena leptocephala]|nr:hypothetical protein B0H13DRAFT_1908752 [Mycena leptocephala]